MLVAIPNMPSNGMSEPGTTPMAVMRPLPIPAMAAEMSSSRMPPIRFKARIVMTLTTATMMPGQKMSLRLRIVRI